MRTVVYARTRFVGFHAWPAAPDGVAFLRSRHRHEFHVRLDVEVTHADRDVEFITLRRWLDGRLSGLSDLGSSSCEDVAGWVLSWAREEGYRPVSCEVSEDGENGTVVTADVAVLGGPGGTGHTPRGLDAWGRSTTGCGPTGGGSR